MGTYILNHYNTSHLTTLRDSFPIKSDYSLKHKICYNSHIIIFTPNDLPYDYEKFTTIQAEDPNPDLW